ncbi:hypothetical protein BLNAU_1677 [Blattamonas nauphoetae]|uniref:Uncharacterized protein n=1 Tax=Blattamonas nauphoetae TaxID=2049346 RepID=A0ABQ9YHB0_9EUKA|nr:hypothetical protein BLNAU_1677 [Blattamonas nauphoetae]
MSILILTFLIQNIIPDCLPLKRVIHRVTPIPKYIDNLPNLYYKSTVSRVYFHCPPTCRLSQHPGLEDFLMGIGSHYSRLVVVTEANRLDAELFNSDEEVLFTFDLLGLSSDQIVAQLQKCGLSPDLDDHGHIIEELAIPKAFVPPKPAGTIKSTQTKKIDVEKKPKDDAKNLEEEKRENEKEKRMSGEEDGTLEKKTVQEQEERREVHVEEQVLGKEEEQNAEETEEL